ncbi:NADH dehydrogenase 1 beta subcomplex subunit 2 [Popillia japonica]|uniref:NADH dehydrogenase 1 beta subcomplex subunit 2 n=1 Tax=Popillia japonica TaxID=7064 RepID=A0AAW1LXN9_POPJA
MFQFNVGRINARFLKNNVQQFQQSFRNSHGHWNYRVSAPETDQPKFVPIAAECVAGFMWWWILWHLWTEPGHVTGEFDYPIAKEWTDAELGIPEE